MHFKVTDVDQQCIDDDWLRRNTDAPGIDSFRTHTMRLPSTHQAFEITVEDIRPGESPCQGHARSSNIRTSQAREGTFTGVDLTKRALRIVKR